MTHEPFRSLHEPPLDVRLTPDSQAFVDAARERLWCSDCNHQWKRHTSGGMCDGAGTECWCVRFPPTGLEATQVPYAALELVVPEPEPRPRRSRWHGTVWLVLGIAWIVGFVLLAAVALHLTAPLRVEPTAPASEAAVNPGSAAGLLGSRQPSMPERRVQVLGAMVEGEIGSVLLGGKASWMPAKYGASYLAMRIPKGTEVRICAATCLDMTVNDYGPSKRIHPDRIADIAVGRWESICGLPRSRGVCRVTVEYGGGPRVTLPPTDAEETP